MKKVIIITLILIVGVVQRANANNGWLEIQNYVDSIIGTSPAEIQNYDDPSYLDGYDSHDSSIILPMIGRCSIYSDIGTHKLRRDSRHPSSTTDFNIKLIYYGTPNSANENHLEFSMPFVPPEFEWIFGNKPIIFQSDKLPYSPVVDVRKAIAQNGGVVPLIELPAGSYSTGTPYGDAILTIGTRLLGDLNDSNDVDFKDYAELVNDFGKPQGQYVADICGPSGIPDGYVDNYDLAAFCEDWLKDINDPSTW